MKLSCADTTIRDIINFLVSSLIIVVLMVLVFISYVLIISTIRKITSAEGRKKAFTICTSHLTVVILHQGCASTPYPKPKSEIMRDQDQLISMTYTVFTPVLNPVVYTLRNKEVKDALHRAVGKNLLPRIFGSLIYTLSYCGYFCNHKKNWSYHSSSTQR